jgi:hypothetical protein
MQRFEHKNKVCKCMKEVCKHANELPKCDIRMGHLQG